MRLILAVWLTMKGKCRMPPVLAGHNTFIAWAPSSGKSFLIKQIYECTTKTVYVTGMTVDSMLIPSYPTDELFFKTFATLKGSHWSAMLQRCVRTSWSPPFHFRSHLHIIFPSPPTGRDMRRKKWEVSSLVTIIFSERSDPPRNLRVQDFRNRFQTSH